MIVFKNNNLSDPQSKLVIQKQITSVVLSGPNMDPSMVTCCLIHCNFKETMTLQNDKWDRYISFMGTQKRRMKGHNPMSCHVYGESTCSWTLKSWSMDKKGADCGSHICLSTVVNRTWIVYMLILLILYPSMAKRHDQVILTTRSVLFLG